MPKTRREIAREVDEILSLVGTSSEYPHDRARKEHEPRLARPEAWRVVGCSCGWQCPLDERNSDDAFTLHAAYACLR